MSIISVKPEFVSIISAGQARSTAKSTDVSFLEQIGSLAEAEQANTFDLSPEWKAMFRDINKQLSTIRSLIGDLGPENSKDLLARLNELEKLLDTDFKDLSIDDLKLIRSITSQFEMTCRSMDPKTAEAGLSRLEDVLEILKLISSVKNTVDLPKGDFLEIRGILDVLRAGFDRFGSDVSNESLQKAVEILKQLENMTKSGSQDTKTMYSLLAELRKLLNFFG